MKYKDYSHARLDEGLLGGAAAGAKKAGKLAAIGRAASSAGKLAKGVVKGATDQIGPAIVGALGGKETAQGRYAKAGDDSDQVRRTGQAPNPDLGTDFVPSMTRVQQRRVRAGEAPGGPGPSDYVRAERSQRASELGQKKIDRASGIRGIPARVIQSLPKSQAARVELAKGGLKAINRGIGGSSPGRMSGVFDNDANSLEPKANAAFADQLQVRRQARELMQLDTSLTYGQAMAAVMQRIPGTAS